MQAIKNNFDSLRMLAALMVIYSHQHALMGLFEPAALPFMTWGGIGVLIFFSISGFLITQSWCNDPRALQYLYKRLLRLWPALFLVTFLSVVVLGPIETNLPLYEYWQSSQTWAYFRNLIFSIRHELPGVFSNIPYPKAVNGSLWTIPIEFKWYLIIMLLGLIGFFKRPVGLWVVMGILVYIVFWKHNGPHESPRQWLAELGIFFMAGCLIQRYQYYWRPRIFRVSLVLSVVAILFLVFEQIYPAVIIILPMVSIIFGTASWVGVNQAGRWGDPSYGLYIYAFPLQQFWVSQLGVGSGFAMLFLISLTSIVILAYASWHLVEKHALALKRKLN